MLSPAEGRQWLRLRQLRVRRAREALAQAISACGTAQAAVNHRQDRITQSRDRLAALAQHWCGAGSVDMPRWAQQVKAYRQAMEEQLDRDEYALIEEHEALEAAQAVVIRQRAELARAQAREDAVDATLKDQRQRLAQAREQQSELDTEDARRVSH